jgi:CRP-like cAMP-binding protein
MRGPQLNKPLSPFYLSDEIRAPLEAIAKPQNFDKGKVLFHCGDPVVGVYLIRKGAVALSVPNTPDAPRVAGPGCVLGLAGSIGSQPYSLTGETLEAVETGFIPHQVFLDFLRQQPEVCLAVTETLAAELYEARRQASTLLNRFSAVEAE